MGKCAFFVLFAAFLSVSFAFGVADTGGGITYAPVSDAKYGMFWLDLRAGPVVVGVDKGDIAFTKIFFVAKSALRNAEVSVTRLADDPPVGVPENAVFQYIRLDKKNIGDEDISGLRVLFRVEKKWVASYGSVISDVRLLVYDGKWNELVPLMNISDGLYQYFTADIGGFSYFAIALKAKEAVAEIHNDSRQVKVNDSNASSVVVVSEEEVAPKKGFGVLRAVLVGFSLIALLVFVFFVIKKAKGGGKKPKEADDVLKRQKEAVTFEETGKE